jgi:putative SOS response-associated peptidase YedK
MPRTPPAYRLNASAAQIAAAMRANIAGDVWPGGEVVPGGYAPVIISDTQHGRHIVPRQWGVPPPPRGDHLVPFVRNLDSPFWIGTLRHTQFRCLVPITHIRKGKDWLANTAQPLVACAGIWRDSEIPSFAIVTAGGNGPAPVVVAPQDFDIWLRADIKIARKLVEGPVSDTVE